MSHLKQFESREAMSPSPMDMTDALSGQRGIGDSKKIATKDPARTRILFEFCGVIRKFNIFFSDCTVKFTTFCSIPVISNDTLYAIV